MTVTYLMDVTTKGKIDMINFKELAEAKKRELIGNTTSIEEFTQKLQDQIKQAWENRENAIEENELKETYTAFSILMRSWRGNIIKAERYFKNEHMVKLEALALGFTTIDFNNDELDYLKKLSIKTSGSNVVGSNKYQTGMFKSLIDYVTFKNLVIENYDLLSEIAPSLMEVLN